MDDATQTFIQEADELLVQMEDALLALEDDPGNEELINSVFRAMHTIKAIAGNACSNVDYGPLWLPRGAVT